MRFEIKIYILFTFFYQISSFFASKSIVTQGISWYFFPAGIVYLFFLLTGPELFFIYFVNVLFAYTYVFENTFPEIAILQMAIYKCFSYLIFISIAKKIFSNNNPFKEPIDIIKFACIGIIISSFNALTSIHLLLEIPFDFSVNFITLTLIWIMGDIIGQLFIIPPIFALFSNYFSKIGYYGPFNLKAMNLKIVDSNFIDGFKHIIQFIKSNYKLDLLIFHLVLSILATFSIYLEVFFDLGLYYISLIPMLIFVLKYSYGGSILSTSSLNFIFLIIVNLSLHEIDSNKHLMEFQFFLIIINITILILGRVVSNEKKEQKRTILIEKSLLQSQKLDAIGRSTSYISHEFKNIIQIQESYIDIMKTHNNINDVQIDLTEMKLNIEKAKIVIQKLLSHTEISDSTVIELSINQSLIRLKPVIEKIIDDNIEVRYSLDDKIKNIKFVKDKLEQIIINLVLNSNDAISKDGVIEIKTNYCELTDDLVLFSETIESGEYVILTIYDNGCGISDNIKERMFEPFNSNKPKGTGLGLSSIRAILNEISAKIIVNSVIDEFTRIEIWFKQNNN